jgi:hypothetical protein
MWPRSRRLSSGDVVALAVILWTVPMARLLLAPQHGGFLHAFGGLMLFATGIFAAVRLQLALRK